MFYPATSYPLSTPAGQAAFLTDAGEHVSQLWGLGQFSMPSSLLRNQEKVSFWVKPRAVVIGQSQPQNPTAPNNLCTFGSVDIPPFANVNAIIHREVCRDNAPGGMYSALSPLISWHEIHHAAFGLADEYCCDGGYFQTSPFPNVYFWPNDCRNDPDSGANCNPIRASGGGPFDATRWWKFDLDGSDVMTNNTFERVADIRRANWYFGECDQGRC